MFDGLPRNHYGAILADPPWRFRTWNNETAVKAVKDSTTYASSNVHYFTMPIDEICALPIIDLAANDCSLFLWATWPNLLDALQVIKAWGFEYKSCGFLWVKAHAG